MELIRNLLSTDDTKKYAYIHMGPTYPILWEGGRKEREEEGWEGGRAKTYIQLE